MLIFKRPFFFLFFFFTDLSPNTLYRKCTKFGPSKGGGGSSDPLDPPFPTPLLDPALLKTLIRDLSLLKSANANVQKTSTRTIV